MAFRMTQRVGCGSSVKFCRLAEGAADLYPRLAPTHDWDIAAGHAILVAAGGSVVDPDGGALRYGSPTLIIPAFLAWGGPPPTGGTRGKRRQRSKGQGLSVFKTSGHFRSASATRRTGSAVNNSSRWRS